MSEHVKKREPDKFRKLLRHEAMAYARLRREGCDWLDTYHYGKSVEAGDLLVAYDNMRHTELVRLRKLEQLVRTLFKCFGTGDGTFWMLYYAPAYDADTIQAIGRLLEGAEGIVTTQCVADRKEGLTQDEFRRLHTQEWPDKQEAEGE